MEQQATRVEARVSPTPPQGWRAEGDGQHSFGEEGTPIQPDPGIHEQRNPRNYVLEEEQSNQDQCSEGLGEEGWTKVQNRKMKSMAITHQQPPKPKQIQIQGGRRWNHSRSFRSVQNQGRIASEIQKQPAQPLKFLASGKQSSWKEVCKFGRVMADDCRLDYFQPKTNDEGKLIALIPKSDIKENIGKWEDTLVGYVIGDKPFYTHLKACVGRLWKPSCSLQIFSRENGFFYFKFGTKEESERVLQGGPWLFDGRLIVLKRWSPNLGLERDLLSSIPIWIRFPSLNLILWSNKVLSRIASVIGVPLFCDTATANGDRYAYARVFVEVSAKAELPTSVMLEVEDGESQEIELEYEWVPPRCSRCCCFGHKDSQCTIAYKEIWKKKMGTDTGKKAGGEDEQGVGEQKSADMGQERSEGTKDFEGGRLADCTMDNSEAGNSLPNGIADTCGVNNSGIGRGVDIAEEECINENQEENQNEDKEEERVSESSDSEQEMNSPTPDKQKMNAEQGQFKSGLQNDERVSDSERDECDHVPDSVSATVQVSDTVSDSTQYNAHTEMPNLHANMPKQPATVLYPALLQPSMPTIVAGSQKQKSDTDRYGNISIGKKPKQGSRVQDEYPPDPITMENPEWHREIQKATQPTASSSKSNPKTQPKEAMPKNSTSSIGPRRSTRIERDSSQKNQ